jgi:hypothetical protein
MMNNVGAGNVPNEYTETKVNVANHHTKTVDPDQGALKKAVFWGTLSYLVEQAGAQSTNPPTFWTPLVIGGISAGGAVGLVLICGLAGFGIYKCCTRSAQPEQSTDIDECTEVDISLDGDENVGDEENSVDLEDKEEERKKEDLPLITNTLHTPYSTPVKKKNLEEIDLNTLSGVKINKDFAQRREQERLHAEALEKMHREPEKMNSNENEDKVTDIPVDISKVENKNDDGSCIVL